MKKRLVFEIFLLEIVSLSIAQRVAPGVPPQQYQYDQQQQQYQQYDHKQQQFQQQQQQYQHQPPAPQHHQQQQFQQPPQHVNQGAPPQHHQQHHQQQQQQQQFQQPPQAHQQPPQAHQQPPQAHHQPSQGQQPQGHSHNHGHGQSVLSNNIEAEREHIQEHMEVPNIDTSKMSENELQFYYFKMHDSDHNDKLDGCELIKSLIHWHEQGSKENPNNPQAQQVEEKIFTDDELLQLIDPILRTDDTSNDGFIDYPEFVRAQQKAAANQQHP